MSQADEEYEQLLTDMETWEKTFSHKKPCQEYKETGWCLHLANAEHKKFKQRIDRHINSLIELREAGSRKGLEQEGEEEGKAQKASKAGKVKKKNG